MVIFNSFLLVYQRVAPIESSSASAAIPRSDPRDPARCSAAASDTGTVFMQLRVVSGFTTCPAHGDSSGKKHGDSYGEIEPYYIYNIAIYIFHKGYIYIILYI